jgi:glycosyltransferase involved in cell wall biosynthesis
MNPNSVSKGTLLLLTYYWPPAGGIGVQRWLSMTSHLCDLGWSITVMHPSGANYPLLDEELVQKIDKRIHCIGVPIFEARKLFNFFTRGGKDKAKADELFFIEPSKRTYWQRLSLWIRANIFIPDARVTWVKPLLIHLDRLLQKESFDFVISSGPPHSIHLSALQLKTKYTDIQWVADFRDPWTGIEYHDLLPLTQYSKKVHKRLESEVLRQADIVLTVSPTWAKELSQIRGSEVNLIANGFEEKDFIGLEDRTKGYFVFCHCGTFSADRWIPEFWEELFNFLIHNENKEKFVICLAGKIDVRVKEHFKEIGLEPWVQYLGELSHEKALEQMMSSDLLYLPINQNSKNNKGRLTGKIYEYIATKVPILIQGPADGDAYHLVNTAGVGEAFDYSESKEAVLFLRKQWEFFLDQGRIKLDREVSDYSRQKAAEILSALLWEMKNPKEEYSDPKT